MGAMASQITNLVIVYLIVYSGADQRKHQSSASLAFVRGIHRWPVNSPHKWPVARKMFPFDDVIMLTVSQVNWVALGRARAVMTSMKAQARIILLFVYGPDVRVLLITALEKDMLEGMLNPFKGYQMTRSVSAHACTVLYMAWFWFGILTHLPLNEMAAIPQKPCSKAFSWIEIFEFQIKFQWNLFLGV